MTDVQQQAAATGAPDPDDADWTVTQDRTSEAAPSDGGIGFRATISFVRRSWRGLTSMRTALILLFLLAIAAIPGSLLPQEKLNADKVAAYLAEHRTIGPLLDRVGAFNVFASAWFSAIYLLLFISLVGCLVPRLRGHIVNLRRVPPDAPARLHRLPVSRSDLRFGGTPADAGERLRVLLRSRRYRTVVRSQPDGSVTVSAEKGYLKETGNLLFHFALLALLIGVAYGSWFGWHGGRLLVAGNDSGFCNTVSQLDDLSLGARMNAADLEPFCLTLNRFHASYLSDGQPVQYSADVSYTVGTGNGPATTDNLRVNHPLRLPDANVYLIGHGYAPIVKYTDKYGHSVTQVAAFLPQDGNMTSTGAIMFPDVNINPATGSNVDPKTYVKQQMGFAGFYYPTVSTTDPTDASGSVYPAEDNPMLVLVPYRGDLGIDNGVPQSVYTLDQAQIDAGRLTAVDPSSPLRLRPGQTARLDDGSTVEFLGTRQWVSLSLRYDPGEKLVLGGAIALVIGLLFSLTGRRRRVWFRVASDASGDGRTVSVASAGGLARAEYASFPVEFEGIVDAAVVPGASDSAGSVGGAGSAEGGAGSAEGGAAREGT
jgi:cytochrome c biogenesis protein